MKYALLGVMTNHSQWMQDEISRYRSLKGFYDNETHLDVNRSGEEAKKVTSLF